MYVCIYLFVLSSVHFFSSFVRLFICLFVCLFFVRLFICLFVCSFVYLFVYLFVRSFVRSFLSLLIMTQRLTFMRFHMETAELQAQLLFSVGMAFCSNGSHNLCNTWDFVNTRNGKP